MRNIPDWCVEITTKLRAYRITQLELAKRAGISEKWTGMVLNGSECSDSMKERMQSALETIIKERGE